MSVYVLYHRSDNDGLLSAGIFHSIYTDAATYIGVRYGESFPSKVLLGSDSEVYIVDFSYPRDIILDVKSKVGKLVVLDHHTTAEEELKGIEGCVFDKEKSGCRLAWDYFYSIDPPAVVDYVMDRDLWQFKLGDKTKEFHAGVEAQEDCRKVAFWSDLISDFVKVEELIIVGNNILKFKNRLISTYCGPNSEKVKVVTIDGLKVGVTNTTTDISDIGEAIYNTYDVDYSLSYFMTTDGSVVFSFRSAGDKALVNLIAKSLGGGGHAHAAGAKLDLITGFNLLSDIFTKDELSFAPYLKS